MYIYKKNNKLHKIEIEIYHILGVRKFRRFILWFERVIHLRDKKTNENYHPQERSVIAIEKFKSFIFYNVFLHAISLLFVILYFILSNVLQEKNLLLDILVIFLLLLNLYCIMLQRYNFLRLEEYNYKFCKATLNRISINVELIKKKLYLFSKKELNEDLNLLIKIRNCFLGKSDLALSNSDMDGLKRIYECIQECSLELKKREKIINNKTLIDEINSINNPYSKLNKRADKLKKIFNHKGRWQLKMSSIITESKECEYIYRKIIPEDSFECLFLIGFILCDIYEQVILEME